MGNIGIHSQKEQRFICHECHKTFSARKGTVFYRLRTSAETVALVVTLLAYGCPVQALVAAFGFDERTVAAWWARAGLAPLDATALLRNVLQGLQTWLDLDASGKPPPQLPRAFVDHWHGQLHVVLAVLEGPRGG
jgi:hypothetical protein